MAEIERRAERYGLPPMRWPDGWPGHYLMAMRAATYALRMNAGRDYTMSAFRLAFREGGDLSDPKNVLEAAERAGLDAREVERATEDPEIKQALKQATEGAHELGVFGVPTVAVDGQLFWGDDRLEAAAAHVVARACA